MNVARLMAQVLAEVGVRRVYGLPGEDHMAVLAEFQAAGLEYCTAYNESSAVIMAQTEAQLSGLPGVVVLSLAPGLSNAYNGLLNASLEQVPLLVIAGQHASGAAPLVVRQGFDTNQMLVPVTKWRARIAAGSDVVGVVAKGIDEAMSGRPGPVYLEVADEVATGDPANGTELALATTTLHERWSAPSAERAADTRQVEHLREVLGRATRPALVIGGRRRRLSPAVVAQLASAYRMPVFTSTRQKGVIDPDHPWFAGTFLNGAFERSLLTDADLVLMVDPDPFDFYNRPWCFDAPSVAIVDSLFTEWLQPLGERLVADPDALLAAVASLAGEPVSGWRPDEVAGYRSRLRSALLDPGAGMSVPRAVDAALQAWPRDGYLVADAGFSKPLVAMLSESAVPDRFLASNALSTMGYSIPAGVAAGRAGAAPVLGFLGDGSLLMRATELMVSPATATRSVWVAIMDRSLTQIGVKQRRRDLAPVGVDLPAVSCERLGAALGIVGHDVDNAADLTEAVRQGLEGGGPCLIGAMVDTGPSPELYELLRG
jgi:acetolactate synthase-1/2/3 large subunit